MQVIAVEEGAHLRTVLQIAGEYQLVRHLTLTAQVNKCLEERQHVLVGSNLTGVEDELRIRRRIADG